MRLSGSTAVAAVLASLALTLTPTPAHSQQPIRIVRHLPVDTIRTGDAITISFDRPIAGSMERGTDPARIVRFTPALKAKMEWRDPTTIRVIPNEPLAVGQRYRVTVDTGVTAIDGAKLETPYRFVLETRGPVLVGSYPRLSAKPGDEVAPLDAGGGLTLVYSAPFNVDLLTRVARVELADSAGCAGTIRMQPAAPTAYMAGNANILNQITYSARADTAFMRVVELKPETVLPESCTGRLYLPSFDANDIPEVVYKVTTASRFELYRPSLCEDACADSSITLIFSGPLRKESFDGRVRISPATRFTVEPIDGWSGRGWRLRFPLVRRQPYQVTFDSSFRDIFGRPLSGATVATYRLPDRRATLGHQLGFFTVPRQRPVLRVAHVNVDSVEIAMIPIADSMRSAVIDALREPDSLPKIVATQRDTVWVRQRLVSALNTQRTTDVPIPTRLLAPGSRYPLIAMRARAKRRPQPPAKVVASVGDTAQLMEAIEIIGLGDVSTNVALVQVTDLVAHAKVNDAAGGVLVTNMNSGAPVRGASVTVRDVAGDTISRGTTDATGVAAMTPNASWRRPVPRVDTQSRGYRWGDQYRTPLAATYVEVSSGTDRSITPYLLGRYSYEWNQPSNPGTDPEYLRAMIYPDREIYRPGEKVHLGAIVRRGPLNALRTLNAGDSVKIRVATYYAPTPEILRDTVLELNRFGTVADSFTIATGAALGYFDASVSIMRDGKWRATGNASFRVAEYRAPQFRLAIDIDSADRLIGDTLPVHAEARYYFSAPMSKAVIAWSMSAEPAYDVQIPGLPRSFTTARRTYFDNQPAQDGGRDSGEDTLDVTGRRTLRLPTDRGTLTGPARVTVAASVTDVDRQTVLTEKSAVMHTSDFYIAVRDSASRWYWRQGERKTLELLAVRLDGRRVSGARITATVIRHHGSFVPTPGSPYGAWKWLGDTVSVDSLVSADSVVRYSFTPSQSEWYEVRFSALDRAERAVVSSMDGYVIPRRWAGGWGLDPTAIGMKLARDTVALGDSAVLSFVSPFPRAEAWVTVEREGILAQRRARVVSGENTVAFHVDSSFGPTATVSLLLVDASEPMWKTDSAARRFRYGTKSLVVERTEKRLTVEITPVADRYAPGDSVRVSVRVTDHRRRPVVAQVSLWAVDESVLALTDWSRPNAVQEIYADRWSTLTFRSTATMLALLNAPLQPAGWTWNVYGRAAMSSMVAMSAAGRAASVGPAELSARKDFRSTAFYFATLITDANGELTTSAKLPDNLTSYRLVAVVVDSADRFGGADTSLLVTKPLIARSALPRFVRTGDRFAAGAAITNQTGSARTVVVTASATAATLLGNRTKTVLLDDARTDEVRFDWATAAPPGDTAVFTFGASGSSHADAVETKLPVEAPHVPRYHANSGVVRGGQTVTMRLPRDIDVSRSKLTLHIGTTPIPTIRGAYDSFRVYPYQCTEQLTSAGRSIVALYRLQQAGVIDSLKAPSSATLRRRLQDVADELSRRQADDGSIGYWARDSWSTPPLSAEAGRMLLDVRDIGIDVRQATIDKLAGYVRRRLEPTPSPDSGFGTRSDRMQSVARRLGWQLAALHYLRRAGVPNIGAEDSLLESATSMVWEDRVWLAELFAGRSDQAVARQLLRRVWQDVAIAGTRADVPASQLDTYGFPSRVRPAARLLMATLAIDATHPHLFKLVETVVRQTDGRYVSPWNTQDYASAAEAMARTSLWHRSYQWRDTVVVRPTNGSHAVLLAARAGRDTTTTVSLDGLVRDGRDGVTLSLQIKGGNAPAFYAMTVEEVPRTPPTTPDAQGIVVERWYERFDDGRPVTEVKEGELVRVRLRVTVPSNREYVVVADPLPAGLEAVDLSLRTSSTLSPFESEVSRQAEAAGDAANRTDYALYGRWWGGWWSPWEHTEQRDDCVVYFARWLWKGSYSAQYVARATTAGTFVKPPAHAEEMYNQSLGGRSDGGVFRVLRK